jgi:vitamin K-dependent gamma-carboxylase
MQTGIKIRNIKHWLNETIDARVLGIYRIIFGLFMAYNMVRYIRIGLIENMFVLPRINFKYDGFYWLERLPPVYLNIILGVLLICALLIAIGVLFKWASRLFALGYLYIFLLDKSIYNNHIYLFILIAILLSFTNADKAFSLGGNRGEGYRVARWQQVILQIQIVIVYFYGGIAKLTHDWLFNAEPIRSLVSFLTHDPILFSIFNNEPGILFLNYGGLLLDLGAPLLLWYKPLRKWSVWVFIGFNFTNSRLFQDIGIFPFVMLANLILFYEAHELPGLNSANATGKKQRKHRPAETSSSEKPLRVEKWIKPVLISYFIFQFLFPFRGHFLPNALDWTTIGNRFSWRMKVDTRTVDEMKFFIDAPAFNVPVPVEIQTFINDMQIQNLSMDPRSVRDFAVFLKNEAILYDTKDPEIKASIKLKYNGRDAAYFVKPDVDLASMDYNPFQTADWVAPVPR